MGGLATRCRCAAAGAGHVSLLLCWHLTAENLLRSALNPPHARSPLHDAVTIALAVQSFGGAVGKAGQAHQAVVVLACKAAVIFFTIVLGAATSRLVKRLLASDGDPLASFGTLGTLANLPSIAPGGVR